MIEWRLSDQHLIGEHADRPNIYEVIVGLSLEDFGTNVVESAAVGGSSLFAVGRPSEVAQLAHALNERQDTLERTMF